MYTSDTTFTFSQPIPLAKFRSLFAGHELEWHDDGAPLLRAFGDTWELMADEAAPRLITGLYLADDVTARLDSVNSMSDFLTKHALSYRLVDNTGVPDLDDEDVVESVPSKIISQLLSEEA